MLLSAPLYNHIYHDPYLYYPMIICIPLIYLANISGLLKAYLEAYERFYYVYIANTIEMVAKILFTVLPLILFKNLSIYQSVSFVILSMLLSEVISLILLAFKVKKYIKRNSFRQKTNRYELLMLKQALPLTIESIVVAFSSYITPFIYYFAINKIGIITDSGVTYYALVSSYAIPLLICGQFPVITISNVIFSNLAKNIDNQALSRKIFEKAIVLALPVACLIFILCKIFPKESLLLLYNEASSYQIVIFMAPIYFFLYFNPILVSLLQARKKEKLLLIISIITQVLTLIFIYIFSVTPAFNTAGYMIGLSLGSLARFIALLIFSLKELEYKGTIKLLIFSLISILYISINFYFKSLIAYFTN